MEEIKSKSLQESNEDSDGHYAASAYRLGHPEALVGGKDVTYSRHFTAHGRIIYDIYDDCVTVLIVQAEEHYNDK